MRCFFRRFARRIAVWLPPITFAIFCLAPAPLLAIDKFWIDPAGGPFGFAGNWDDAPGGPGGDPATGAGDVANFTLNNTYQVDFTGVNVINTALEVENGNVTFDLNTLTYTLTNNAAVFVGSVPGQTGRLTVRDGMLAVNSTGKLVFLGSNSGSNGFLTVTTDGRIGDGTFRPDFFVGDVGTGTLTVNDNGRIDARDFNLGNAIGAAGSMTITGPNAVVGLSGSTTVGDNGAGTVNVTNGGTLTTTGVTLGNLLGADGTAMVSGIGSSWTISGTTTIGNSGDGTLTISAGGLVSSANTVTLGSTATGFGTATVTGAGSRWNLSAGQTIGSSGLGVMTVSSGGQVVSTTGANLGSLAGGEGRVTVTGAGSQWTVGSGTLTVGGSGSGDLTVSAGGEVIAPVVMLGSNPTSVGVSTVTGAGSKLRSHSNVTVASTGFGTLNVASDGELYVALALTVNNPANAPLGTLNLDGGSIFVGDSFTNNSVFNFTDGLLQVAGNFQPSAGPTTLTINGRDNGDLPTLDLIGNGTTTNVTGLTVGSILRGQLLLRQGRVLNLGINTVGIGTFVGGEGTLSVQSGAQLLTAGFLEVGGSLGGFAAGRGTLNIAGGTVDVGTLELFRDGTVNLSSGTLAVNSLPTLDGQFNWTGGMLRFDAAFSLTSTNVPKLLGLDATLNAGQALTSNAGVNVTLQTPVIVDGGSLNASTLINQSRIDIRSGSLGAVTNNGLILGDGLVTGAVTNGAGGRIRVDAGKTLSFTGSFAPNAGELNLQGGTLDISDSVANSATGFIAGRGALYTNRLTNAGQMAFSGGNTDLHGDVTLEAGSRVVTSGAGSVTTFFDDVDHNGLEIFTGVNASTVFFGDQTGAGNFTGTGTVYFIGDLRPGNSPATISHGGSVVLGSSTTLTIEIGGVMPGSQLDRINVAGSAMLDGTLNVATINGLAPTLPGQSFTIMTYSSHTGTFDSVTGAVSTSLDGLYWTVSYTPTSVILTTSALPGDIDLDGAVDRIDAALFSQHFGTTTGAVWTTGDFNGDGMTSLDDLRLLQSNFGASSPSPTATALAVPEPSSAWLLALAALAWSLKRLTLGGRDKRPPPFSE